MDHLSWLLLLHQIPPKPPYFRAKVLRRLNQLGALPIKNSAYVLPAGDEALEDLQWLRQEILQEGGEAWVFRTEVVAGLADDELQQAFRELRRSDYAELAETARKLLDQIRHDPKPALRVVAVRREDLPQALDDWAAAAAWSIPYEGEWRKLKRRYDEVRRIDFFGAPQREQLEATMDIIDHTLHSSIPASAEGAAPAELKGCTWITRRGPKVDRIASAWLIRRFIDAAARFRFVDPQNYTHHPGELRFDMFEGEFTHQGDLCTFEVLLRRIGIDDPALQAIAEVVHDIDLKDSKYQRAETAGIASLIEGIVLRHTDDGRRLDEGATIFDALYTRLQRPAPR